MPQLSPRLPWDLANPQWAAALNPVIANALLQGKLLTGLSLAVGDNIINHGLGRTPQGWIICDQNAAAFIYRNAAFNNSTLTLNSSATVIVSLYVL